MNKIVADSSHGPVRIVARRRRCASCIHHTAHTGVEFDKNAQIYNMAGAHTFSKDVHQKFCACAASTSRVNFKSTRARTQRTRTGGRCRGKLEYMIYYTHCARTHGWRSDEGKKAHTEKNNYFIAYMHAHARAYDRLLCRQRRRSGGGGGGGSGTYVMKLKQIK